MLCVLSSVSACVAASRCRCPMRFFVRYRRRCLRCCAQSTLPLPLPLLLPGASACALFFFGMNSVEFLRLQSSNATKAPNRTRSAVAASACDCDCDPFPFTFTFLFPRSRSRYCSPCRSRLPRSVLSDSAGSEDQAQWGDSRSDAADRQISLRIHTICTIYTHTHTHVVK